MWDCDTYKITLNMITCAKQLSSAYKTISSVLASQKYTILLLVAIAHMMHLALAIPIPTVNLLYFLSLMIF